MAARDIIVTGASAGGFDALQKLAAALPAELPAALFITLHVHERSQGILPAFLKGAGPLPAADAIHGEEIRAGRIYVAPLIANSNAGFSTAPGHFFAISGSNCGIKRGVNFVGIEISAMIGEFRGRAAHLPLPRLGVNDPFPIRVRVPGVSDEQPRFGSTGRSHAS
jgi:hypothetical protein